MLKHITEELQNEIIRQYEEGVPARAIARALHLSNTGVRKTLARAGIAVKKPRAHLSKETQQAVIQDCLSGMTIAEAARKNNIGSATVSRVLRQAGISRPMGPRQEYIEQMKKPGRRVIVRVSGEDLKELDHLTQETESEQDVMRKGLRLLAQTKGEK